MHNIKSFFKLFVTSKKLVSIVLLLIILMPTGRLDAHEPPGKWSVTFYYIGLGLRHYGDGNMSWELRGTHEEGTTKLVGRLYRMFKTNSRLNFYACAELSGLYYYVSDTSSQGAGVGGGLFGGVQYYILDQLSVSFDIGPGATGIWDFSGTSNSDYGVVYNYSINFIFGL